MKIKLSCVGKTNEKYLEEGIREFESRIKRYNSYEMSIISDIKNAKNLSIAQIKDKEGALILSKINQGDFLILLDENGKEFTSVQWANQLQKWMLNSHKYLHFVIGGAYGFSEPVYKRANFKIAFSKMTFSHQMIRLIFTEQMYRAFSILNNEPYHHV